MSSEYVELYLDRGTDFNTTIRLNDENSNLPQNVTGYVVTSNIKKSLLSTSSYASFTCNVASPLTGEITLSMTAANTNNLVPGRYFFDVKIVDVVGGNTTSRLIEGPLFVTHSIT